MPYKDPAKERQRSREKYYRKKAHLQANPKPEGVCSVQDCPKPSAKGRKKCEHHLAYMREYHKKNRKSTTQKIEEGICTSSDCTAKTDPPYKQCSSCREKKRPSNMSEVRRGKYYVTHKSMRDRVKLEMIEAYGGVCVCCGEDLRKYPEFATLDHIGGYDGTGPRKGNALYAWAKRNGWPNSLRLLCFNCNFTIGHHGYCVHGLVDEKQKRRAGRPITTGNTTQKQKIYNRNYYVKVKTQVMEAYGGQKCACCGITDFELLSIDHIGLTGADHREKISGNRRDGRNLYYWLIKNNFPPGYRVLCHQCNFCLQWGYCPHDNGLTP